MSTPHLPPEAAFERTICEHLADHGWLHSPNDEGYDRVRALYPPDLFDFLAESQPEVWAQLVDASASSATQQNQRERLLRTLTTQLDNPNPKVGGTITTLRRGLTDPVRGTVRLAYPKPVTDKNPEAARQYAAMRVRFMQQVHFHPTSGESVDLVLFVNGIPVATLELKTDLTQTVQDAVKQYRDRNHRATPLFGHGTRAVVHFAVSDREVMMTTRLNGPGTAFLPFNLGHDGGAGNPPNPDGSDTAYLWQRVLDKDAWLGILQKFVFTEEKTRTDAGTGKRTVNRRIIFPRYHQWEAVTEVLDDAAAHGAGQKYLIEHSAGSGKTNTIAWTAHQLLRLHRDGAKEFDSVIVVTDRTVLDDQLQRAILAIETTPGTVVAVNDRTVHAAGHTSKSQLVADTLQRGNRILVVTLQTFPSVLQALQDEPALAGRRYAVVADEAHSSQTGTAAAKLRRVLSPAEQADLDDGGEVDVEAVLAAEVDASGPAANISYLAFTATPKPKTLELFGRPGEQRDENEEPIPVSFHRYPMKQAIQEGFILDVLQNYTTYETAFQLARLSETGQLEEFDARGRLPEGMAGEEVDQEAAASQLRRWVKLHPETIAQKVEIIVEHFHANVAHLLKGQAKAMVVTDSRLAALRYKTAMDAYLAGRPELGYGTLVAFSGEVQDPEAPGVDPVTEARANPGAPADLAAALDTDDYAVMIVANKYQTGFDQPKLSALYVDKKLDGVLAVQTLSRLNRTMTGKHKTFVLDFVNTEEDILAAFRPYYEGAELEKVTDPARLAEVMVKLDGSGLYTPEEMDAFVSAMVAGEGEQRLKGLLNPVVARFLAEAADAQQREDGPRLEELRIQRKDVRTYLKLYDFLSQVYRFHGTEYLRHAYYLRALDRYLPSVGERAEVVDISDVRLVGIRQDEVGTVDLRIDRTEALQPSEGAGSAMVRQKRMGPLDEVIQRLNEAFAGAGFDLAEADSLSRRTVGRVKEREEIRRQAMDNTEAQFVGGGDVDSAITLAMWELVQNQAGMSEFLNRDGDEQRAIRADFARAVWLAVRAELGGAPVREAGGGATATTYPASRQADDPTVTRGRH